MDRFTGGCLCGNVRIVASGLPYRVGLCHCLDCRKHHGVMGRTTRFHDHMAHRQLSCPPLERVAPENTSFNDRAVHIQHAHRNDILCEINANRSKLFHDFPSCSD